MLGQVYISTHIRRLMHNVDLPMIYVRTELGNSRQEFVSFGSLSLKQMSVWAGLFF